MARRTVSSASHAGGPPSTVRRCGSRASLISQVAESHRQRRAVVDGVVVDVVADREHRLGERGGPRPAETHPLVAGHVDDQAAGREGGQVVVGDEDQRRVGVLQHAVDDDVVLGEEGRQAAPGAISAARRLRSGSPGSCSKCTMRAEWIGEADRGDAAVGEDVDVVHAVRVEGGHRAAAGRPEADDGRPQPAAVVAGRPDELQRVQHRAVAGQLVVLVEDVQVEPAVGGASGSSPRRRSASAAGRWPAG